MSEMSTETTYRPFVEWIGWYCTARVEKSPATPSMTPHYSRNSASGCLPTVQPPPLSWVRVWEEMFGRFPAPNRSRSDPVRPPVRPPWRHSPPAGNSRDRRRVTEIGSRFHRIHCRRREGSPCCRCQSTTSRGATGAGSRQPLVEARRFLKENETARCGN